MWILQNWENQRLSFKSSLIRDSSNPTPHHKEHWTYSWRKKMKLWGCAYITGKSIRWRLKNVILALSWWFVRPTPACPTFLQDWYEVWLLSAEDHRWDVNDSIWSFWVLSDLVQVDKCSSSFRGPDGSSILPISWQVRYSRYQKRSRTCQTPMMCSKETQEE